MHTRLPNPKSKPSKQRHSRHSSKKVSKRSKSSQTSSKISAPVTQTNSQRSFFKSVLHKLTAPSPPKSAFDVPPIDLHGVTKPQHYDFQPQYDFNQSPSSPPTASTTLHSTSSTPFNSSQFGHDHHTHPNHSSHNAQHSHHSPNSTTNTQHATSPTTSQPASSPKPQTHQHHRPQPTFRQFSPVEAELTTILCSVNHPDTNQDLIQSEFVTQIKETSPGNVVVRIKLDKHFRHLKSAIEEQISSRFTILSQSKSNPSESNPTDQSTTTQHHRSNKKVLNSLKITLADSQDDLSSLDPVKNAPQSTSSSPTFSTSPISSHSSQSSQSNSSTPPSTTQNPTRSAPKITTTSQSSSKASTPTPLKVSTEFNPVASMNTLSTHSTNQQSIGTQTEFENGESGAGQRGLSKVKRIIFVYSAKGGVGKSSIAANLAVALSETPYVPTSDDPSTPQQQKPNRNLKVGIFDADIYGPSLPSIIDTVSLNKGVLQGDGLSINDLNTSKSIDLVEDFQDDTSALIRPISAHGIKMMSYGYVTRTKGGHGSGEAGPAPAIMRGGMVSPYLTELLTRTNWGDLDALVIDMPPGTSDIHITLTQQVKNASAVIVTTPNKLAFVDVVRGLQLLDQTNIPVISLVQNMSYFIAPDDKTKKKHYIFGKGDTFRHKLRTLGSIPTAIEMPIIPTIAENADVGLPLTMQYMNDLRHFIKTTKPHYHSTFSEQYEQSQPDDAALNSTHNESNDQTMIKNTLHNFAQLAHDVAHWSSPAIRSSISRPEMSLEYLGGANRKILIKTTREKPGVINPDAQFDLDPFEVRANCICAACIHEFTGTKLSDRTKIDKDVHPVAVQARGAYAVAIQWSDGHSGSIYTWEQLKTIPRM